MSSTQSGAHALGIYKCPEGMPMPEFIKQCEGVMDTIIATSPHAKKFLRYEMIVPNTNINEHLERLGLPVASGTIILLAEWATTEHLDDLLGCSELRKAMETAKANIGLHVESSTFAYDVIRKC